MMSQKQENSNAHAPSLSQAFRNPVTTTPNTHSGSVLFAEHDGRNSGSCYFYA